MSGRAVLRIMEGHRAVNVPAELKRADVTDEKLAQPAATQDSMF